MYPLTAFSVLIWMVGLQKYFVLLSFGRQYRNLHKNAMEAIASDNAKELKWICKNSGALIGRPYEVLFEESVLSSEAHREKLYRRLGETQAALKRGLWVLGTIGSSAPFVGLFGTVMGIMSCFKAIGASGKSGFAVVASGISESLTATAAGIIVAVVAVIFYNYFQVRINSIFLDFKNKLEDVEEAVAISKIKRKAS